MPRHLDLPTLPQLTSYAWNLGVFGNTQIPLRVPSDTAHIYHLFPTLHVSAKPIVVRCLFIQKLKTQGKNVIFLRDLTHDKI
jgi:hypothetical protein